MKVFVWTRGHAIAESLYENPPEGVRVSSNALAGSGKSDSARRQGLSISAEAKTVLDRSVYWAGLPRLLLSAPRVDLIHTVSGLVPIAPIPWITSVSMPSSFYGLNDDWHESKRRRQVLKRILRSKNCKRVTCFSHSTLAALRALLDSDNDKEINEKFEVLYPAVDQTRFRRKRRRNEDRFRILFVGNHFFDKGGRELHRAVSKLARGYDVQLDLVTDAPPHHKDALEEFMKHHKEPWVRWHVPGVTRRRLIEEFYPSSDVFVMCSYIDVFGFVFLEAMASGLPVIGANVYAQREIISHGENGYRVNVPASSFCGNPQSRTSSSIEEYRRMILDESIFDSVVSQLVERLGTLIEERNTWESMARTSLELTSEGRFGVPMRNRQLGNIYRRALE